MNRKDKKFDTKYLEIALMGCYFFIPFFGLQMASKNYLRANDLSISYILLLVFIGANIMTWMIFIMDGKNLKIKSMWAALLLLVMIGINFMLS